ncbi:MAG: hypothetical protein ACRDLT_05010 [Solirubrobacteraceae bacterium]
MRGHHVRNTTDRRDRPSAITRGDPGTLGRVRPAEQGQRYPANPTTVEEIIL